MISGDLGRQLESYIQQLVDTGRYGSKSEVLREGVRLVQGRETRLAALDASIIMRGISDADSGRTIRPVMCSTVSTPKYRAMAEKDDNSA
jgi:antitoxin ParD1/3/4